MLENQSWLVSLLFETSPPALVSLPFGVWSLKNKKLIKEKRRRKHF